MDEKCRLEIAGAEEVQVDSNDEKEMIEVEEEEFEDKFDCESILTTYSNIYNHPKLISEPSIKPIRVSGMIIVLSF